MAGGPEKDLDRIVEGQQGLMLKMSLRDFKAKYGEHRAIAALAVIVEDEAIGKKRMIHENYP